MSEAHNIVGRISANERLAGSVLIGAHYDHLGLGGRDSLEPESNEPHNGADDNASGTAALLQTAKRLLEQRDRLQRDVLFVAFSGEESGLLGSTQMTREPPPGAAPEGLVAMLNMDMGWAPSQQSRFCARHRIGRRVERHHRARMCRAAPRPAS